MQMLCTDGRNTSSAKQQGHCWRELGRTDCGQRWLSLHVKGAKKASPCRAWGCLTLGLLREPWDLPEFSEQWDSVWGEREAGDSAGEKNMKGDGSERNLRG